MEVFMRLMVQKSIFLLGLFVMFFAGCASSPGSSSGGTSGISDSLKDPAYLTAFLAMPYDYLGFNFESDGTYSESNSYTVSNGGGSWGYSYQVDYSSLLNMITNGSFTASFTNYYLTNFDMNNLSNTDEVSGTISAVIDPSDMTVSYTGTLVFTLNNSAFSVNCGSLKMTILSNTEPTFSGKVTINGTSFDMAKLFPFTADSYEPDDSSNQTHLYSNFGTSEYHTAHVTNDNDWLKFDAISNKWYTLETVFKTNNYYLMSWNSIPYMDTRIILYDSNFNELQNNDDSDWAISPNGYESGIEWQCLSTGTYFVQTGNIVSRTIGEYYFRIIQADTNMHPDSGGPESINRGFSLSNKKNKK
jgi:hypothetical protein